MNNELMTTILQILIPVLATAIGTVLIALANSASTYLKQRTSSNLINHYVDILESVVADVVMGLNQTTVQRLKEAAEDGKLTKDEIAYISGQAIDSVKAILGVKAIEILKITFEDVDALITNKIEHMVLVSHTLEKEDVPCNP